MRSALTTTVLLLLAGLAFQPALCGWRGGGQPHPAPRPQMRAPAPRPAPQFAPRPPQFAQQQRAPMYEQQRPGPQMGGPGFGGPRPAGPSMSRGDAIRQAQERSGGGRVLGADPAENGYRVRVLKNGEVSTVYVQQ